MKQRRLTRRKLEAMADALVYALAGEWCPDSHTVTETDMEQALDWVEQRLERKVR